MSALDGTPIFSMSKGFRRYQRWLYHRAVGLREMGQFTEGLVRPHVADASLDDGYRAMADDKARETEAMEWCNARSFSPD